MVRFFSDQKLFYGLYIIQRSVMLVFKYVMNVIGPLLHAIALLLIIGIVFVYYLVVFPNVTRGSAPKYVFHLIVSTLLSINILFNLISCAFTSPGYAPPIKDPGKILGLELNPVNSNQPASYSLRKKCLLAPGVYYKYCKSCKTVKPPRAHHCSVTGRCVYEMDHYCPWMNNCVGLYNYKYFYLFLVHLFVGCLYFMITIGSEILTVTNKYERIRKFGLDYPHEIVSLTFVVALGACISVGLLLLWHSYLVVTNQTTIEFYINMENRMDSANNSFTNPFDQGFAKNLDRLFGNDPWYYNAIPMSNMPIKPLYPLRVLAGVFTDENDDHI